MQKTVQRIIRALTGRKPYLLGNRPQETVPGNRPQETVQKTVGSKPSVKNRREATVQKTVGSKPSVKNRRERTVEDIIQPSVRLVINLETGAVKAKL